MSNQQHPIWGFLRYVCMLITLCIVLWICADNFDDTEYKSIGGFALAMGVGDLIKSQIQKHTHSPQPGRT